MLNSRDIEIKPEISKKQNENMPILKFYSALKFVVSFYNGYNETPYSCRRPDLRRIYAECPAFNNFLMKMLIVFAKK